MIKSLATASLVLALAASLSACGSGDTSGTTPANTAGDTGTTPTTPTTPITPTTPAAGNTTTMGTRGQLSQPATVVTSNAGAVWTDYNPAALYPGTVNLPTQFITMKDGTQLAAQVTLPADASGKAITTVLPAILIQTAYNESLGSAGLPGLSAGADPYMIEHGYATVVVDVRGTGNSQGNWDAFGANEQSDYGQVVDWVTQQSWSNGAIGLFGESYMGITAALTAELQKPAVKAAFPTVPIGDGYRDTVFTGGQLNATFIPLWLGLVTGFGSLDIAAFQSNPVLGAQVLLQHLLSAITVFQVPILLEGLTGDPATVYDGGFWSLRSPIENATKINVPTFIIGGLHDIFQRSEPLWFEALKGRVPVKLLIGPWFHTQTYSGLPVDGVPAANHIELMWFDQYVKGMNVGADTVPNVTQYVLGYDHYVTTTDWPHPQVQADRVYLHADKSLSATIPASGEAPSQIIQVPIEGLCSLSSAQWTAGLLGQVPLGCFSNDNINQLPSATYSSAPMTADYYFNGPIEADIWISTTASDAGLSVRVSDYDPVAGSSTPITNGLLTASFRAVDTTRSRYIDGLMMQPWHPFTQASVLPVNSGEIILLPVEIFSTSAMIAKGHQIRISIAASNIAQGVQPLPTLLKGIAGVLTVYSDAAHPSSVTLPKAPATGLN